ncbi:MAG TPA: hypothetical protein VF951_13800, partial [Streptosporangiaceae bacterium]
LAMRRDPCGGAWVVPSETTIRRALAGADAGALDEQLAAWLGTPNNRSVAGRRTLCDAPMPSRSSRMGAALRIVLRSRRARRLREVPSRSMRHPSW